MVGSEFSPPGHGCLVDLLLWIIASSLRWLLPPRPVGSGRWSEGAPPGHWCLVDLLLRVTTKLEDGEDGEDGKVAERFNVQ